MQYNPCTVHDIFANTDSADSFAASTGEKRPTPIVRAMNEPSEPLTLLGPGKPSWCALENDSRATLLKTGNQRKVWRVQVSPEMVVCAKVFDDPAGSPGHWWKRILRVHPAMREWRALQFLQARSIPAVLPLTLMEYGPGARKKSASSDERMGPRVVLLTEGLNGAATLSQSWGALPNNSAMYACNVRSLTAAVAGLWATAHKQGYAHPDGHPANVLVGDLRSAESVSPCAYFIDPAHARWSPLQSGPIHVQASLRSLAMLDQYFHRTATRTQRLRFWRNYWLRREILLDGRSERRLLDRFAGCALVHRTAIARRRDRRLRGDRKYFGRLRLPDRWRATVVLQIERRHVFPEVEIPDRNLSDWAAMFKNILRFQDGSALALDGVRLVRRPKGVRGAWAESLFRQAHCLRHRDIPAPLILGFLQRRSLFGLQGEYLILPGI